MKKKLFSKLLMGAVLLASMSSFVSCKDYDDDIKNLQDQINKAALQTDLTALQNQLAQVSTTATTALQTAESALTKANNAATADALAAVKATADKAAADVVKAIADAEAAAKAAAAAQKTADDAATAAANAQKTGDAAASSASDAAAAAKSAADAAKSAADAAKAAQTTADKAIADAAAAAAAAADAAKKAESAATSVSDPNAATKDELAAALKRIGDLEVQIKTADGLSAKVSDLETKVAGLATPEEVASMRASVAAFQGAVDALWSAVTSVSLYYNWFDQSAWNVPGTYWYPQLIFVEAEQKENVFPANAEVADAQVKFEGGKMVTHEDSIVIRVSPTNATLKPEMISLINSQGEVFDNELVSVTDVHPFVNDDEPLTRATANTGLWTVVFKLKDGYDTDAFALATRYKTRNILFAIGVNNTKEEEADRLVVSEYDLVMGTGTFTEAYTFAVNDNNVESIHNRYLACEDGTVTDLPTHLIPELNWLDNTDDENPTPDVKVTENNSVDRAYNIPAGRVLRAYPQFNAYDMALNAPYADNRQAQPILSLTEEVIGDKTIYESIKIEFPKIVYDVAGNVYYTPVKAFYVTLDQEFALESAPSENNAWRSYSYNNVGFKKADGSYQKAHLFIGNEGTITVNNLNGVKGDIIGFRVYAVNVDGTLVDPDGRAFYVRLGEVLEKKDLDVIEVTVRSQNTNNDEDDMNFANTEIVEVAPGFFAEGLTWTTDDATIAAPYRLAQSWNIGNPALYNPTPAFIIPVEETANQYTFAGTETTTSGRYALSNRLNVNTTTVPNSFFNVVFWNTNAAGVGAWAQYPDETTTKVKATINRPNEVLDGETYSMKITGYNQVLDGTLGTILYREPLQEITIRIKKVMPNDLEGLLSTKAGQLGEKDGTPKSPLTVFMKPVDNTGAVAGGAAAHAVSTYWDIDQDAQVVRGEDILPFDLSDIFNGLQSPLSPWVDNTAFSFVFHDSDVDATTLAPTDMEMTWDRFASAVAFRANSIGEQWLNPTTSTTWRTSYFLPNPDKSFVGDGKKKDVDVKYSYVNVSLKYATDGSPLQGNYDLIAKKYFQVEYRCALQTEWIIRMNPNHSNNTVKANAGTSLTTGQINWVKTLPQLNYPGFTYADKTDGSGAADLATVRTNVTNQFDKMPYEGNGLDLDGDGANDGLWYIDLNVYFYNYNAAAMGTTNLAHAAFLKHAGLPCNVNAAGTASVNSWQIMSLGYLLANKFLKIVDQPTLVDKNGGHDYYVAQPYTAGQDFITLKNTRANEHPSLPSTVEHTLSFTVEDVFGHQYKISEKIIMQKPVVIHSARKK